MEVLPLPVAVDFTEDVSSFSLEDPEEEIALEILADRIGWELREAKARHINGSRHSTEVLIPSGLLHSVAEDVLRSSRDEPCGMRGCVLYIDYEDSATSKKRIGVVKCDSYTVNTFELYLTLRPDCSSWTAKLPQFLRNLANLSTMVISPDYSLSKRKLFRSSH